MGYWPDPTPFEAEDGSVSASLDALIRGPGAALPGLLLLGDPSPGRAAAARAAAIRLARAWVGTGRRTVLADLDFGDPGLHALVGVPNDEGVADHFAFGTSFTSLARPADDGSWSLVPAGPFVENPAEVRRSADWGRLLRDFAANDAVLLAFVSADAPGVAELAQAFGAVVVLGAVPELPEIRPYCGLAVLELPEGAAEPVTVSAAAVPERESADAAFERIRLPTEARAREALIADLRYRQRAARMAPPSDAYRRPSLGDLEAGPGARPAAEVSAAEPGDDGAATGAGDAAAQATSAPPDASPSTAAVLLGEPPPPRRAAEEPGRRSYRPLWWALAAVVLLSVLAATWYVVRGRLEARRRAPEDAAGALVVPQPLPQPASSAPARAAAADTVLAYAVSVGQNVRLPSAEQRMSQLRSAVPGARLFIAPVVREEALYYDVLAGPAGDSAAAAALADSLAARRGGLAVRRDIRLAPYAFLLGEYRTIDSARARVAALRRLEIPSYALPLAGPPARFRVYAGAYTGPVDAEVMKQILQSVGEPDVLVPRVGKR